MDIVINAEIASIPENNTAIPTQGNFYHNILSCLGYPNDSPPVADLLRRYHHLEGEWVIASPIHWQATHNDAMIIASGSQLELSEQESKRWFEAFKEFIASENMHLHYHDAYTWLFQYEDKPQITAKPVHVLQHQSMMPELEMLDKTLFWQRFITESQMFFSGNALNKARIGLYPINGVWLWGGGALGDKIQTQLICHDPDLIELANVLSTNVVTTHASTNTTSRGFQPGSRDLAKSRDPAGKPRDVGGGSVHLTNVNDVEAIIHATKNSIVLCNNLGQNACHVLQEQLQKKTVRWYWNNIAYQSRPKNWISRLMERI